MGVVAVLLGIVLGVVFGLQATQDRNAKVAAWRAARAKSDHRLSICVCFLTRAPTPMLLKVAGDVASRAPVGVRVTIMSDSPPSATAKRDCPRGVTLWHLGAAEPTAAGFCNSSTLVMPKLPCIAWDKALYMCAVRDTRDDFVWFVEDDVLFPSPNHLLELLADAESAGAEYVCPHDQVNTSGDTRFWHWHELAKQIDPPWGGSLVVVVGMSRRLLQAIKDFAAARGRLMFIETLFSTLAMHLDLKTLHPPQIRHLTYNGEHDRRHPGEIMHPVKNPRVYQRLYSPSVDLLAL